MNQFDLLQEQSTAELPQIEKTTEEAPAQNMAELPQIEKTTEEAPAQNTAELPQSKETTEGATAPTTQRKTETVPVQMNSDIEKEQKAKMTQLMKKQEHDLAELQLCEHHHHHEHENQKNYDKPSLTRPQPGEFTPPKPRVDTI